MKKQFFYAAMAVAMMASCTSEDNLSVDPITPDVDDKVAIELGVDAPSVNATVGGRSVGSVGDVSGAKNTWNGQKLFITMVDKNDGTVVMDTANNKPIMGYSNYYYYAPRGEANDSIGSIRLYKNELTNGNDKGTLSYVYYPVAGQYDFYGYHVDDCTGVNNENPTKITGITITGQQDVMGARTKEFNSTNYSVNQGVDFMDMIGWNFSARTARNGIKPVLKFEHQLARLKFFVKAGSAKTAVQYYDATNSKWVKNQVMVTERNTDGQGTVTITTTDSISTAMMVKSIKAKKMINTIDMNLDSLGVDGKPAIVTTAAGGATATNEFFLYSYDEDTQKMKEKLDSIAPQCYAETDLTGDSIYDDFGKGTPVGESIMFFPNGESQKTVELEVELSQLVRVLENENDSVYKADEWEVKTQKAALKVHAASLLNQLPNAIKEFEPGKSYNIYITVYGFERIEVTAELTAWEMGGDVDVDVEEGESRHNVPVTFTVKDADTEAAINDATIVVKKHVQGCTSETEETAQADGSYVVPSFTVLHYSISKQGYDTVEGTVNAQNGVGVTIKLKSNTPATGGESQGGGEQGGEAGGGE